jgi:hypothetical protein
MMDFEEVYDFDLMMGSGHLTGFAINDPEVRDGIMQALKDLVDPDVFSEKYNLIPGRNAPLLFAMGDGNHSLATAKAIWEKLKPTVGMNHPARYALVEIENVHDPALTFEPIHRLVFGLQKDILAEMEAYWGVRFKLQAVDSAEELMAIVDEAAEPWHQIGLITTSRWAPSSDSSMSSWKTAVLRKLTTYMGLRFCLARVRLRTTSAFTSPALINPTCSKRSFWMVHCHVRPSPWVKPIRNGSIWSAGRSSLNETAIPAGFRLDPECLSSGCGDKHFHTGCGNDCAFKHTCADCYSDCDSNPPFPHTNRNASHCLFTSGR